METTACWLLLATHLILICHRGKTCCHSSFGSTRHRNSYMISPYVLIFFFFFLNCAVSNLLCHLYGDRAGASGELGSKLCPKQTAEVRVQFVFMLFLLDLQISSSLSLPELNMRCATRCASLGIFKETKERKRIYVYVCYYTHTYTHTHVWCVVGRVCLWLSVGLQIKTLGVAGRHISAPNRSCQA